MTNPNARGATTRKYINLPDGIGTASNSEGKTLFVLSASEMEGRNRVSVATTYNPSAKGEASGISQTIKPYA